MSPKILCVDDEAKNLVLLEAILVPRGYSVILAENGENALAKAVLDSPDLILLDVMMPKMSGFEVLQKLRSDERTRLIPVVMVTALKDLKDRVIALEFGCDDFLTKPFEKIELIARVKSLLNMSYYRRKLDEKEKFTSVIGQIGDGVIVCDRNWKVASMNSSALKFLNISDTNKTDIIDVVFNNFFVSISKEALMDLYSVNNKFDIERKETENTKPFYLAVNKSILKNPDGEVTSIVFTLRDVSEERREEHLKQDFLGFISHKLRTPLLVITQYTSMMKEGLYGSLNDQLKAVVDSIFKQSCLIVGLVEKLLRFVALSGQCPEMKKESLDLKSFLNTLRNTIVKRFAGKKAEIDIMCPEDAKINTNAMYLNQIILNLVENAIKFNDKETAKINILVNENGETIEFSISDNGLGIPKEEHERIFEKFYQVEKCFTGQIEGIGLGLALVKKLVENLGGEIMVESKIGEGSTFRFVMPIRKGQVAR
jgi:signal transduction histidine kinase